jgi:hypothetical protein
MKVFRFLHFKQLQYGVKTVLYGLIPGTLAVILFQLLIDIKPYDNSLKAIVIGEAYDIKMLVYYAISAIAHLIVCSVIIYHFLLKNERDLNSNVLGVLRRTRLLFLIVVFFLLYFLDRSSINVAYLSHDRLYILLSKSSFFKNAFRAFPSDYGWLAQGTWFHLFSIIPFGGTCIALGVMVYGSFYIGKELYNKIDKTPEPEVQIKEFISGVNASLKKYVQLLSIVLVSSTIGTVLFFQIPVALIKDEALRKTYSGVSMSMGICWGVIFSLTLLFLCIFPYRLAHRKYASLIQNVRIKDDPELEKWLENHGSYFSLLGNAKLVLSIIAPTVASFVTTVLSKNL